MSRDSPKEKERNRDPALDYLAVLREETMRRAWGDRGFDERRRIVVAAMVFGEQFDKQLATPPSGADQKEVQRLLMGVIRASIDEFARRENLKKEEAASFLSEVGTRDLILEFNEVLEAQEMNPDKSLRQ